MTILLIAVLVIAAVFATQLASRIGLPILLAFLGLGMLAGSDVLNLIYFDDAMLTRRVADILLIFILFEAGLQTKRSAIRRVLGPALSLATLGVILTAAVLGFLIHLATDFDLRFSLLVGAIISSTDAAAVLMITRRSPIEDRVATTLEVESAANDPMAILLAVGMVELISGQTGGFGGLAVDLVRQFAGGVTVGFAVSRLGRVLFDRLASGNRGDYYVLGIGIPLLAYGLSDAIGGNGILAVFFAGCWLGNSDFACKLGVSHFLGGVASLCNVALFLMLGLLAFPRNFAAIWREGFAIAALMILVARPLAVALSTLPFRLRWRERLFVAWGGIKGAVPIVLATYPAAYGIDTHDRIFNLVFFAVFLSCLIQGSTLAPLARLLRLTVPAKSFSPYSVELHAMRRSELGMFEVRLEQSAAAAGRKIRELELPQSVLISSIVRDETILPPKGDTILAEGDLLFVLAPTRGMDELALALNAPRPEAAAREGRPS